MCTAPDVPAGGPSGVIEHYTASNIYAAKMRNAPDGPPGGTSGALHIIMAQISM